MDRITNLYLDKNNNTAKMNYCVFYTAKDNCIRDLLPNNYKSGKHELFASTDTDKWCNLSALKYKIKVTSQNDYNKIMKEKRTLKSKKKLYFSNFTYSESTDTLCENFTYSLRIIN